MTEQEARKVLGLDADEEPTKREIEAVKKMAEQIIEAADAMLEAGKKYKKVY